MFNNFDRSWTDRLYRGQLFRRSTQFHGKLDTKSRISLSLRYLCSNISLFEECTGCDKPIDHWILLPTFPPPLSITKIRKRFQGSAPWKRREWSDAGKKRDEEETPSPESAVNHAVATRSTDRMAITVVGLEKIEARAFNFKPLSTLARSSSLLFDESASWKKTN